MVVYVDILLFINMIVNYAVLATAEKLLKRDCRLYRLLLGAFIGSLFSLAIFQIGDRRLLLLPLKLLCTASIALITFGWQSRREYIKAALCCLAVSVVYCGFFILFYQLFKPPNMMIVNDVVYFSVNPLWLTALTAAIYLVILLLYKVFAERFKSTVIPLSFTVDGRAYSCIGKIDTGCNLREPFSCAPVIIADTSVFVIGADTPGRIVPYTALGGSSYLRAVKAQAVAVDHKPVTREIYIASASLGSREYQAIINSEITR